MTESTRCPKCGIHLPADAPAGLCPKCLVQAGFESQPVPQPHPALTVSSPASSGFEPPSVKELAGKFQQLEILEFLGKGGMGAVYKARQRGLDRLVAVKVLPPEIGHDAAFAVRFSREARALARLSHSHIVSVYDFGQTDGLFYIVMEYVDGVNLRQTIQAGGLSPAVALAIVPQICEALQYAHDEGIVHRDIKPENILIDRKGRVKIADFGLAKLLGHDAADHSLTGTHQVMGTVRYMAPEQMEGLRDVDHRADIYSLGVVFYEMLTGELPLGRFAPPSHKVQIDVRLDEVVLHSLEKEPERRYQQAREVKTDVEAITSGHHRSGPAAEREKARSGVDEVEVVRDRVKGPALGLLVAGAFTFVSPILLTLGLIVYGAVAQGSRPVPRGQFMFDGVIVLGMVNAMFTCPLAVVIMVGALSMKKLQARWLALTAGVLAVLPLSVAWLVSLPIGIWSLVVLNNREAEEAFHARRIEPESLCQQIKRLAVADWVLGILAVVLLTLLIPVTTAIQFALDPPPTQVFWEVLAVGVSIYILSMIPSVLLIVAARKMRQLQSYAWAVTASLLVMLTVIGLPIGLWSLAVLTGRDVRSVFGKKKSSLCEPAGKQTEEVAGVESSRPQALASQQPPAWGSQTPPQPPIAVSITWPWPRLPAWYGWVFGAGFVVAVVVTVVFVRITMNSPSQPGAGSAPPPPSAPDEASQSPASRAGWIVGSNGPALSDFFARSVLKLQPAQIEQVNEILQAAHREYLTIEQQNTEQHTDDAGHFVTTIKPFPNPLAKLEDRLWSQLDAILDSQQQSVARLNLKLHPKLVQAPMALSEIVAPGFFGWGKDGAQIEIWRVGTWFHWRIGTRGYTDSAHSAAGLPVEYRRFWKEPTADDARIQGTWGYVANIYDGEVTDPEEFKLWKEVFAKVQRVNGVDCHSPMTAESFNRKPQASALNRDRLRPNALACGLRLNEQFCHKNDSRPLFQTELRVTGSRRICV